MNKSKVLWCIAGIVIASLASTVLFSQDSAVDEQEARAFRFEQVLDSLRVEHARLAGQAEIVAQRIDLYRDKANLNTREHRHLEKQLQESQRLEMIIRDLESRINEVLNVYRGVIDTLVSLYQSRIDTLLTKAGNEIVANKEALLQQIQTLLDKKRIRDAQLLVLQEFTHSEFRIEPRSWDTVEQLRMKGNLLLDQEEALRREIELVDTRITSLDKEKQIRIRMDELADDLELFNEREELVGRQSEDIEAVLNNLDYWRITTDEERTQTFLSSPQSWEPEPSERTLNRPTDMILAPRSPALIDDSIERLEHFRNRLAQRADSLQQKSEWFFNEAKAKQE